MINLQDLRTGNLIKWKGEVVRVTGIFEDKNEITAKKADGKNVEDIADAFEEISLNEEWLVRAGFKLFPWGWTKSKIRLSVHPTEFPGFLSFAFQLGNGLNVYIGTFSHLQNIFRDFFKEELCPQ